MACSVPTQCSLCSPSLLSLPTVHYHTRPPEGSWGEKSSTLHSVFWKKKRKLKITMKMYFTAHEKDRNYPSFQIIPSVMLLFILSLPFFCFVREDQPMSACTFCSVIINQETVWIDWWLPAAGSKGFEAALFKINMLGTKVTMYIPQDSI